MSDKNDAKQALKILSGKCSVQRVNITDTTKIVLQSTIEQHQMSVSYPIHHVTMKSELQNSGFSNFEFDNIFFWSCLKRLHSLHSKK